MKKIIHAFKPVIAEITHDFMIIACIFGPVLLGVILKFGLPVLEQQLCNQFEANSIIFPYYIIFDLLLSIMTPILFCFAGVLVMLEELDNGTSIYLAVTPIGKSGYLISRIIIPSVLAFLYDIVTLGLFSSSVIKGFKVVLLCFNGSLIAVVTALFITAFAKNRIEGMALVKLCGLLIIGIPVAYFVESPIRYIFGILPSFWMAESCITDNLSYSLLSVILSGILIIGLFRRYRKVKTH